ncbi:hypothetical protein H6P81_009333 [Aristolochia fimbriata]|uniref:Uncharacterized protein n=1 Tax=Aristolochia fimbriata TaxID=158543 RepID=A0AAV7EKS4_ARIFI|nr:hypothetical protein H6P81_009333 [Aristolochia fimbriata]
MRLHRARKDGGELRRHPREGGKGDKSGFSGVCFSFSSGFLPARASFSRYRSFFIHAGFMPLFGCWIHPSISNFVQGLIIKLTGSHLGCQ